MTGLSSQSTDRLIIDVIWARRAFDTVQIAVLVLLGIVYFSSARPIDSGSNIEPVPIVIGILILLTGVRIAVAYFRVEYRVLRYSWPALDIVFLYVLLASFSYQYQLAPAAILKSTTSDAVFLLIALRVIQFDARALAVTGVCAAAGWALLTIHAVYAAGTPNITHSYSEYMMSDKVLIGAQVERILMISLVTLATMFGLNWARRDALTGLGNRIWFISRLVDRRQAGATSGRNDALLLMEIDRGQALRAAGGYEATQRVVRRVARRIRSICGPRDLVARIGDCTIAFLIHGDMGERNDAEDRARRCLAVADEASDVDGISIKGQAVVGIAFDSTGADPASLWRNAQAALAMAGRDGRIFVFDENARRAVEEKLQLEADLRIALRENQLELHYQPIVHASNQTMVGAEALMRWHHPEFGIVSPMKFIPVAEKTGLIKDLGAWAIKQAATDYRRLIDAGAPTGLFMSVNVSPYQVSEWTALEAAACAAIKDGCNLKLELTESAICDDIEIMSARLSHLAELGASLAIDDFGTGYSSYGHLARMPFSTLKIDRSFTALVEDPTGRNVMAGIIGLARSLQLSVIVEGVETTGHLSSLLALGAHEFQGYLFDKPIPIADLLARFSPQIARDEGAVLHVA